MRGCRPPARPRRRASSSSLAGCGRRPRSAAGSWRTSTSTVMTAIAAPVSAGRGWTAGKARGFADLHGGLEGGIVEFVLVGVGFGEADDRLVRLGRPAEVGGIGPRSYGSESRMSSCGHCSKDLDPENLSPARHGVGRSPSPAAGGEWVLLDRHRQVEALFGRDEVVEVLSGIADVNLDPAHLAAELPAVRRKSGVTGAPKSSPMSRVSSAEKIMGPV